MVSIENLKTSNSFCILPFVHQEKQFNNIHNICCYENQKQTDDFTQNSFEAFNSKKMNDLRHKMLQNKFPVECNGCYDKEKLGLRSARQIETAIWLKDLQALPKVENNILKFINLEKINPISYDLRFSNTCSLKCRMCNSGSSSAINAEYAKINNLWPSKFWFFGNSRINHDIPIDEKIEKVYLAGGEPLLESYNYDFLLKLSNVNPNANVLINTSLNNLDEKLLTIFNKLNNLTFVISIDGVGPLNDYIRHGSNWETIIKNIKLVSNHELMFSTTVSMYNIFNIVDLLKFTQENYPDANHGINIVNDVEELFIENTPMEMRPKIIQELYEALNWAPNNSATGIMNVLKLLEINNFDSNKFTNFIKYTKILDTVRHESILDVQPKYKKYFTE